MTLETAVIDDFFGAALPDFLAAASNLTYATDPATNYPGRRTQPLDVVRPDLYKEVESRLRPLLPASAKDHQITATFQLIPCEDNGVNEGWVHSDIGATATCIVYLDANPDHNSGTGLYRSKLATASPNINLRFRNHYYGGRHGITLAEFKRATEIHNSRFELVREIQPRSGRALIMDPNTPHRQMGFGRPGESRLTLVAFVSPPDVKDQPNDPANR